MAHPLLRPSRYTTITPRRSPGGGAVWLEVVPGLFQVFAYWALVSINSLLCFVFIGFITWPLAGWLP